MAALSACALVPERDLLRATDQDAARVQGFEQARTWGRISQCVQGFDHVAASRAEPNPRRAPDYIDAVYKIGFGNIASHRVWHKTLEPFDRLTVASSDTPTH